MPLTLEKAGKLKDKMALAWFCRLESDENGMRRMDQGSDRVLLIYPPKGGGQGLFRETTPSDVVILLPGGQVDDLRGWGCDERHTDRDPLLRYSRRVFLYASL